MKFPSDTKVGDIFWLNDEPVRITAWNYNYIHGTPYSYYFDLDFVDSVKEGMPACSLYDINSNGI